MYWVKYRAFDGPTTVKCRLFYVRENAVKFFDSLNTYAVCNFLD